MQKSVQIRKFITSLLIILSLTICVSPFMPQAHAATPALTISPKQGRAGIDMITVNGTIETTNGNYALFFDSTKVASGVALGSGKFTPFSFKVPLATNGTHTIKLQDVALNHNATEALTVITAYNISALLLQSPKQFQEGDSVEIQAQIWGGNPGITYYQNITMTTPANAVYYNSTLSLMTDQNGTATNRLHYPTDFQPTGANTNNTGTYQIRIYKNATTIGAQNSFFVGLTNATTYQRLGWVNIKAANYTKPSETANVTIKFGSTKINSSIVPAVSGKIIYNWTVPVNCSKGSYKVTVATAILNGTVKHIADAQNFTIAGISVKILTTNLNAEPVGGVNATVYEIVQSAEKRVVSGLTNSSGWIVNTLDHGGNYTFKAFWNNVQVNLTRGVALNVNSSWTLICQLANFQFTIKDRKTNLPMPLIFLTIDVNYTTVTNASIHAPQQNDLTNSTGQWILRNQLTKVNYAFHAYRNQLLFNTTSFQVQQSQKWYNLSINCPTLDLTIHAEDARHASLGGYPIRIYEFGDGSYANATTDNYGNATFSATFGIYKIRIYDTPETVILNETYYSLVNQSAYFVLRSSIYPANLSVKVSDYFGQPVPNAKVTLEREAVTPITVNTDGNGVAFFNGIIGGDCFISVYTGGDTPTGTANVFVKESTTTTITLGNYVSVFGLLMDTSQFAVLLTFLAFVILFVLLLLYRRNKAKVPEEKTAEKES